MLQLAALKGVFADVVEDAVTYVNAPLLASERGVEVSLVTDAESPDWRNLVTLRGITARRPGGLGRRHAERAAAAGEAGRGQRVRHGDRARRAHGVPHLHRPAGRRGTVGQILGSEGINIAGMQVCRDARGGHALIVLTVDSAIPAVVLDDILSTIGAVVGRTVDLDER